MSHNEGVPANDERSWGQEIYRVKTTDAIQ
jgi:hypothetical protein